MEEEKKNLSTAALIVGIVAVLLSLRYILLGLITGIELSVPAAYYINALQEPGIIVNPSGSHVIRLLPPLILEKEHIDALLYVLKKIL